MCFLHLEMHVVNPCPADTLWALKHGLGPSVIVQISVNKKYCLNIVQDS
jgi:hypothetical protein